MKTDSFLGRVLDGEPQDSLIIIDAHMHSTRTSHFFSRFEDGVDLLAQMDRIGVDRGILSSLWSTGDQWDTFSKLSTFCKQAPDRFFAYSSPHPDWEDFEKVLKEQCSASIVIGIKLHPALHHKPFDCRQYCYAYELGSELGLPLLIHTWGIVDVEAASELADRYPKTVFLLGHSGGDADATVLAAKVAADRENVFLDIACSFVWQGAIEYMVHTCGAEKILYGSDAYWNSMEVAVGRILLADITEDEKTAILGRNALRIFHWKM